MKWLFDRDDTVVQLNRRRFCFLFGLGAAGLFVPQGAQVEEDTFEFQELALGRHWAGVPGCTDYWIEQLDNFEQLALGRHWSPYSLDLSMVSTGVPDDPPF